MKAYHYDEYHFYDGDIVCQLDILKSQKTGKEEWLIPANSTTIKPTTQDGATPRWNGTQWEPYPDDKIVYGYTNNNDGTVNYYGEDHIAEELQKKHKDVTLLFTETKPVQANNQYWLSPEDQGYIKAQKHERIGILNAQYDADKSVLVQQYTDAIMHDDADAAAEIKTEMIELDAQYDADYAAIVGGE